jgi:hypothetical protein
MREYQYGYSRKTGSVHDVQGRERKAQTMVAVLEDFIKRPLSGLRLLDVGGSAGIIGNIWQIILARSSEWILISLQ